MIQQSCITKFFKPIDPVKFGEYHEWLFDKEESDRIRCEEEFRKRVKAERDRLRAIQREKAKARRLKIEQRCAERAKERAELARLKLEGRMIIPGLYVGGRLVAQNWDWLSEAYEKHNLAFILNVTPDVRNYYSEVDLEESSDAEGVATDAREAMEEIENFLSEITSLYGVEIKEKLDSSEHCVKQELSQEEAGTPAANASVDETEKHGDILDQLCGMEDEEKLRILEQFIHEQGESIDVEDEYQEFNEPDDSVLAKKTALGLLEKYKANLMSSHGKENILEKQMLNFTYKRISINDDREENLAPHLDGAISFIKNAIDSDKSVLVHCREGRSRSVAIIVAYLMSEKKWTLNESLEHINKIIPEQSINQGFLEQLLKLELPESVANCTKSEPEPRRSKRCFRNQNMSDSSSSRRTDNILKKNKYKKSIIEKDETTKTKPTLSVPAEIDPLVLESDKCTSVLVDMNAQEDDNFTAPDHQINEGAGGTFAVDAIVCDPSASVSNPIVCDSPARSVENEKPQSSADSTKNVPVSIDPDCTKKQRKKLGDKKGRNFEVAVGTFCMMSMPSLASGNQSSGSAMNSNLNMFNTSTTSGVNSNNTSGSSNNFNPTQNTFASNTTGSPFNALNNTNTSFGTPSSTNTSFNAPSNTNTTFNAPSNTSTSFGTPNNTSTTFNALNNTNTSSAAFNTTGSPFNALNNTNTSSGAFNTTSTSFGTPNNTNTSFNAPSNTNTTFNALNNTNTSSGAFNNTSTSFGTPNNTNTSFNAPSNTNSPFNAPNNTNTTFNAPSNTSTSFGTPNNTNSPFNALNNTNISSAAFNNTNTTFNAPNNTNSPFNAPNNTNKVNYVQQLKDFANASHLFDNTNQQNHVFFKRVDAATYNQLIESLKKSPPEVLSIYEYWLSLSPNPGYMIPVVVHNFKELKQYIEEQDNQTEKHFKMLDQIQSALNAAQEKLSSEITVRLQKLKREAMLLGHRLLVVNGKMEVLRLSGLPIQPSEESWKQELQKMANELSNSEFKGKLNELVSRLRSQQTQSPNLDIRQYMTIDENEVDQLFSFLKESQTCLEKLTEIVHADLRNMQTIFKYVETLEKNRDYLI